MTAAIHGPVETALRVLFGVAVVAAPGEALVRLLDLRTDFFSRPLYIACGSLAFVTAFNVVALLGAKMTTVAAAWIGLVVVLGAAAAWRRRATAPVAAHREEPWRRYARRAGVVALIIVASCAYVVPAYLGGEEEIELIITRKLLENPAIHLTNINYLRGLPPTYVLTPFYMLRALLAVFAGLDPVVMHYRLAFLPAVVSILAAAALVRVITRSDAAAWLSVGLSALHVLVAPRPLLGKSPFLLSMGFFRGTFVVSVMSPAFLACLLEALTMNEGTRARAGLALALFATLLCTQAIGSFFLLVTIGAAAVLIGIAAPRCRDPGERRLLVRAGRRAVAVLAVAAVLTAGLEAMYQRFHPEAERLERENQVEVVQALRAALQRPWRQALTYPAPVWHYSYFKLRGTAFDVLEANVLAQFTWVTFAGLLASAALAAVSATWLGWLPATVAFGYVVALRVPLVAMALLAVNVTLLMNTYFQLSMLLYVCLPAVALVAAGSLARAVGVRSSSAMSAALLIGVAAMWWAGASVPRLPVNVEAWMACSAAVFVIARLGRRTGSIGELESIGHPSARTLTMGALLAMPLFAAPWGMSGPTVIQEAIAAAPLLGNTDPYHGFLQRTAIEGSPLPHGLFDALQYLRQRVPGGQEVAADPTIIRTVPLFANQYIPHSGTPFDFVEDYFNEYFRGTRAEPLAVRVEGEHPLFRGTAPATDERVDADAAFLERYAVDYVLTTPAHAAYTAEALGRIAKRSPLQPEMVYSNGGYSIYRVIRPRPDR